MEMKLTDIIADYIHEGKQFSESRNAFYLTVKRIGKLYSGGSLDFGGSEYSEAVIEWMEPEKKAEDDKYGWWQLNEGSYWVEYNERIDLPEKALKAGICHPTGIINEPREVLATMVNVGGYTVGIKENARISEVYVL